MAFCPIFTKSSLIIGMFNCSITLNKLILLEILSTAVLVQTSDQICFILLFFCSYVYLITEFVSEKDIVLNFV